MDIVPFFTQIVFKKLESGVRKELPNHSLSRNLTPLGAQKINKSWGIFNPAKF